MKHVMLVLATLALAGCQAREPLPPQVIRVCPKPKQYSAESQAKAREEMRVVRRNHPVIASYMDDYGALRAQVRACQKGSK